MVLYTYSLISVLRRVGPFFFTGTKFRILGGVATGIPTHDNFGSTDFGFHRARCVFHLGSGQNFIVGIGRGEEQFGLLLVGKCPYMYKMGPAVWSWANKILVLFRKIPTISPAKQHFGQFLSSNSFNFSAANSFKIR